MSRPLRTLRRIRLFGGKPVTGSGSLAQQQKAPQMRGFLLVSSAPSGFVRRRHVAGHDEASIRRTRTSSSRKTPTLSRALLRWTFGHLTVGNRGTFTYPVAKAPHLWGFCCGRQRGPWPAMQRQKKVEIRRGSFGLAAARRIGATRRLLGSSPVALPPAMALSRHARDPRHLRFPDR